MLRRLSPLLPYLSRYRNRYVAGFLTLAIAQLVAFDSAHHQGRR